MLAIDAKLDRMRERAMARWSEETRALYEAWQASQERDHALRWDEDGE